MPQAEISNNNKDDSKSPFNMDNSIFALYKELTNQQENARAQSTLQLVQQLRRAKKDSREKELVYTLKRLVRGCGSGTNISRAGFYTGLVTLLKNFTEEVLPIQQIFDLMESELHVGTSIGNKEDADAVVGKILVIGALMHSGRVITTSDNYLTQIINVLVKAACYRSYHVTLTFSFIVELLEMATKEQTTKIIWPVLQQLVVKPWPKQTLQTIHCLLVLQQRYPKLMIDELCPLNGVGEDLLHEASFQYLFKIYWQSGNLDILMHPGFDTFVVYLAKSKNLSKFWLQLVNTNLETPSKHIEVITVKIATDVINNLNAENSNVIVNLFSENFVKLLLDGLKRSKERKDETLRAFYTDFFESLLECSANSLQDESRLALVERLILTPGSFSIEMYTHTRVIHQLLSHMNEKSIIVIYEIYKKHFLGTLQNKVNAKTVNNINERVNSGYMLQHLISLKSVQHNFAWRTSQLLFFCKAGVFHLNDNLDVCISKDAGTFSKEFGEQCKNIYFSSLQSKMHDLIQEQKLLVELADFCNKHIENMEQPNVYFRMGHTDIEKVQLAWKRMYTAVNEHNNQRESKKLKNQEMLHDKLISVFHILLLHMGFQLFREPEWASPSIDDLLKCMERTKTMHVRHDIVKHDTREEPEWIDVVVDLLLHLLSQNISTLRFTVNAIFPHLCSSLNLNSVYEILSMLDIKSGINPLSDNNNLEDAENEESSEESESDNNDQSNESESDSDVEVDKYENDNNEDISHINIFRDSVSQALMANSALPGAEQDDDMASMDLNDLTEEEGRKLDKALANAFKVLERNEKKGQSKKSKSYRVNTTTLMHFRLRVLDLLEVYLQQPKPKLIIVLEIMHALFNMLEYCLITELQPLKLKVEKLLNKLTAVKSSEFASDFNCTHLLKSMRQIIEKRVPGAAFDSVNRMRTKCALFLFSYIDKVNKHGTQQLTEAWEAYLQDFVKSRNPIVNIALLSEMFAKSRWATLWDLALVLVQLGFHRETRIFRRIQVFEIIIMLYSNQALQRIDSELTKEKLFLIEKLVFENLKTSVESDGALGIGKGSLKEFQTLLELLLHARRISNRLSLKSPLGCAEIAEWVQKLRVKFRLETMQTYQQFCSTFKLRVIRNNEISTKPQQSEHTEEPKNTDVALNEGAKTNRSMENNYKRKQLPNKKQLAKKQKRNSVS